MTNLKPVELYQELMETIRYRLDVANSFRQASIDPFARAEAAALHARKIIEGIAFASLVALENGIGKIPRDAKGHWNAESIIDSLQKKSLLPWPSPSILRPATAEESAEHNVGIVVEGVPENRLSAFEIVAIYQKLHNWLHEANPYRSWNRSKFLQDNAEVLWANIERLDRFISRHLISISGQAFFCVLRDREDSQTKVISISKTGTS